MIDAAPDPPAGEKTFDERGQRSGRVFVARMRSERLGTQDITIRNLSPTGIGARIRGEVPRVGETLWIALGGEEIGAEVRWVHGHQFGLRLEKAIDPARFTFAGKSWTDAGQPYDPGHVYDQFRPVGRAYRPGFKIR